jgi:hypothetical protein
LCEIRKIRRENVPKETRSALMKEDVREQRELQSYQAQAITQRLLQSVTGSTAQSREDNMKHYDAVRDEEERASMNLQ